MEHFWAQAPWHPGTWILANAHLQQDRIFKKNLPRPRVLTRAGTYGLLCGSSSLLSFSSNVFFPICVSLAKGLKEKLDKERQKKLDASGLDNQNRRQTPTDNAVSPTQRWVGLVTARR